ncbi:related to alpha-1,2-mannosyltransferase [Cephalotrichum gorgonifer]|uniref:Related to alpha-1,2-mannosyltransferase n=1 Tax=Cephalotrichum gorgonifer TaxID=2041049 RepID=A0AAE8MWK9_9PEZI|nr:related to alpha-1,2-mannosyltransferase [Cephalotrichum gorgonifer]
MFPRPRLGALRRFRAPSWLVLLVLLLFLEVAIHYYSLLVPRPPREQDAVFHRGCANPADYTRREKAVLVMLARNHEVEGALETVHLVEQRFNRFFNYPIMFLNDEQWEPEVMAALNSSVSGVARFEVIPNGKWGYPEGMDKAKAEESMRQQEKDGVKYGGTVSYHHMCRFFSGEFFLLDALKEYKWYWRIEPNVGFYCDLTYDPFVEMARNNKVYGWTMATWERGETVPSLFRVTSDYKEAHGYATTTLWTAFLSASWLPMPLRWLAAHFSLRDRYGDRWNRCHYWDNFEIADLDFFRGRAYQKYYRFLDGLGGFYAERWGDASVHSLAVGMLLDPKQVHHFQDIAYMHDNLWVCPNNAPGAQLPELPAAPGNPAPKPDPERAGGVGCRCSCPDGGGSRRQSNHHNECLLRLKEPNTRERTVLPRILWW